MANNQHAHCALRWMPNVTDNARRQTDSVSQPRILTRCHPAKETS